MDWSVDMYGLEHKKMGCGSVTGIAMGGLQKIVRRGEELLETVALWIFVGPLITINRVKVVICPYIASSNKSPTIPPLFRVL